MSMRLVNNVEVDMGATSGRSDGRRKEVGGGWKMSEKGFDANADADYVPCLESWIQRTSTWGAVRGGRHSSCSTFLA